MQLKPLSITLFFAYKITKNLCTLQRYLFLDMSFDIVKKQKYAFQKPRRLIFFSFFSCACGKKTVPLFSHMHKFILHFYRKGTKKRAHCALIIYYVLLFNVSEWRKGSIIPLRTYCRLQPLKAFLPMRVSLGSSGWGRLEQSRKALAPMRSIFGEKRTRCKWLHSMKASSPIVVTLSGM